MPNRHARLRASKVPSCCPLSRPAVPSLSHFRECQVHSSHCQCPAPCSHSISRKCWWLCLQNASRIWPLLSPLLCHHLSPGIIAAGPELVPQLPPLFPCSLVAIYQPEGSMWNMSLLCWKSPRGLPLTRSRSKSLQWPLGPTWSNLCPNLLPPTCSFPHSAQATWPLCLPSHTRHISSSGPLYTLYFSWSILISDILTFSKSFPDIPYKTTNLCPLMPPYSSSCFIFSLAFITIKSTYFTIYLVYYSFYSLGCKQFLSSALLFIFSVFNGLKTMHILKSFKYNYILCKLSKWSKYYYH